jgi:hypothetical protein
VVGTPGIAALRHRHGWLALSHWFSAAAFTCSTEVVRRFSAGDVDCDAGAELVVTVLLSTWSRDRIVGPSRPRRSDWGGSTYGWLGISRFISGTTNLGAPTTTVDVMWQIFLLILVLMLIRAAARRLPPGSPSRSRRPAWA